jgi:low affinity Fe/Cu permease
VSGMSVSKFFTEVCNTVAHAAGKPATFAACVGIVLAWAISGPIFGFSDTWQLVINTGTTIITFLMVFLIQNTQNRDGAAMQAKLDELIRASDSRNAFIGIEHLTQEELDMILAQAEDRAKHEGDHETAKRLAHRRRQNAASRRA